MYVFVMHLCTGIYNKGLQQMHCLRKLNTFYVIRTIMICSTNQYLKVPSRFDCLVWYILSCRKGDLTMLNRIIRQAEKIIGQ